MGKGGAPNYLFTSNTTSRGGATVWLIYNQDILLVFYFFSFFFDLKTSGSIETNVSRRGFARRRRFRCLFLRQHFHLRNILIRKYAIVFFLPKLRQYFSDCCFYREKSSSQEFLGSSCCLRAFLKNWSRNVLDPRALLCVHTKLRFCEKKSKNHKTKLRMSTDKSTWTI